MKSQIEKLVSVLFVVVSIMLVVAFAGTSYVFHINDVNEKGDPLEKNHLTKVSNCGTTEYDVSRIRGKLAGNGYYAPDSQP